MPMKYFLVVFTAA